MIRDEQVHLRIPFEVKEDAKKYAVIDNRSLSGFVVEAVKQRIDRMKKEEKLRGN
ncbi:MAG: hypothetical protein WC901_00920 [Candidatus Margulisiibacteriota bacterium]